MTHITIETALLEQLVGELDDADDYLADCDIPEDRKVRANINMALTAGRAAIDGAESTGWQKIETAPKDEKIFLWGKYWNDRDVFQHPMIGMWNGMNDKWECNFNCWFGVHPTHWMPLPAAPKESK